MLKNQGFGSKETSNKFDHISDSDRFFSNGIRVMLSPKKSKTLIINIKKNLL